jgi:hypothetical protein
MLLLDPCLNRDGDLVQECGKHVHPQDYDKVKE